MNLRYFITASATFFSISVAQAATVGLVVTQKLLDGVSSSKSFLADAHRNKSLGGISQAEFACLDNNQEKAVELVTVASSNQRRGSRGGRGRGGGRPSLSSRSGMSF
nr:hypothetical protein [Bartonella senegalensis]